MTNEKQFIPFSLAVVALTLPVAVVGKKGNKLGNMELTTNGSANAMLWQAPDDIRSRNLFYGPGGKDDAPHSLYTYIKEDVAA